MTMLPPSGRGCPGQVGEPAACLLENHLQRRDVPMRDLWLGGQVDRAFGDQQVAPEVAVRPGPPGPCGQVQEAVEAAAFLPAGDRGVREGRVLQRGDPGNCEAAVFVLPPEGDPGPSAGAAGGPPPATQRRRADQADHDVTGNVGSEVLECDQRAPDRHASQVVLGAVDRVDHPPARGLGARGSLFLAEDRVGRAMLGQQGTQGGLGRPVGVRDRSVVGFGLHPKVERVETGHRDLVRGVRQPMRKFEVGLPHEADRSGPLATVEVRPMAAAADRVTDLVSGASRRPARARSARGHPRRA